MKLQLIALLAILLSACGIMPKREAPTVYVPQVVNVAIPVACIKESDIPVEPEYELDKISLDANIDEKGTAAFKEVEQRKNWQAEAKAILKSCAELKK